MYCKQRLNEENDFVCVDDSDEARHPVICVYVKESTNLQTLDVRKGVGSKLDSEWIEGVPEHLKRKSSEKYETMNRNFHNLKENRKGTNDNNTNIWYEFYVRDQATGQKILIKDISLTVGFKQYVVQLPDDN